MCEARRVDADDPDEARHREVVDFAWADYGDDRRIVSVTELSAMVSTNRVYRVRLDDGSAVIAKVSDYGSFFLFAEDHERLHRCTELLRGGPYEQFLARSLTHGGRPYVWYDGSIWAVFYDEIETRDRLPKILTDKQVDNLGTEFARFHRACAEIAPSVPPTAKTVTSDAIHLLELVSERGAATRFGLDRSRVDVVRRHTHRFLMSLYEQGYGYWPKMPVLIDWNLGNFSVEFGVDGDRERFRFFSRWDFDWFRIETRLLDFYFLSRVSSRTGDKTTFTYGSHTLLEPRFRTFLRAYHAELPLSERDVLFLADAYRFFLLNYVVREGRHFFRFDIWRHLLHDVVDVHLPSLDRLDLRPLVDDLLGRGTVT
jgi:hypothetical protein